MRSRSSGRVYRGPGSCGLYSFRVISGQRQQPAGGWSGELCHRSREKEPNNGIPAQAQTVTLPVSIWQAYQRVLWAPVRGHGCR